MVAEAHSVLLYHKSSSLFRRSIVERVFPRWSTAVSDKRSWRVCAGASLGQHVLSPINGCHFTVAEALCSLRAGCGAVMGNLYQYAMRKFSLSGCQTYHSQSSGSTCGALA